MPITLLDIILIGVMLISALLAMIRGFMREILSIAAWIIAAVAAYFAYKNFLNFAKTQISNEIVAALAVVGGAFLLSLIVVSIITVRFSDMVLDSRVGALDRTLGFLFGLGRGFVIVLVAFLFFNWLVPPRTQPTWVTNAKSLEMLRTAGAKLEDLLPEDMDKYIKAFSGKRSKPDDNGGEQQDAPSDQRGALGPETEPQPGYAKPDRVGMQKLIQNTQTR